MTAYRVLDGAGDGLPGVSIDRYGPAAVLNVGDDARLAPPAVTALAETALDAARRRRRDRRLRQALRPRPQPAGGASPRRVALGHPARGSGAARVARRRPRTVPASKYGPTTGSRPGCSSSTANTAGRWPTRRPARVLNLFAYTCAFAVPLALHRAAVTNVDVSSRLLSTWGRRNLALNHLDATATRFLRRDARAFLDARRATAGRALRPRASSTRRPSAPPPSARAFAPGRRWTTIRRWSRGAVNVLAPGGAVFAATNARGLAAEGVLARLITDALGVAPRWQPLPPWPIDVTDCGACGGAAVRAVSAHASTASRIRGLHASRLAWARSLPHVPPSAVVERHPEHDLLEIEAARRPAVRRVADQGARRHAPASRESDGTGRCAGARARGGAPVRRRCGAAAATVERRRLAAGADDQRAPTGRLQIGPVRPDERGRGRHRRGDAGHVPSSPSAAPRFSRA